MFMWLVEIHGMCEFDCLSVILDWSNDVSGLWVENEIVSIPCIL